MNELMTMVTAEKKTLLRGLLFSFVVIFPFTFIPTIAEHGWITDFLVQRVPLSSAYALGFAAIIVVAAVWQNYTNLVRRKRLFDSPAFTALDFYGRIDGMGSIVRELETFLLGKVGDYYYRLNLVDVDKPEHQLEIVPVINWEENGEAAKLLHQRSGFRQARFFGLTIPLTKAELADEAFLQGILHNLSDRLKALEVTPEEIEEWELEN